MHICFITHEYPAKGLTHGGIGSFTQTLAKALLNMGHKISTVGVYPIQRSILEDDDGIKIHRIARSNLFFGRAIHNGMLLRKKIREIHRKDPIDVLEGPEQAFAFIPAKLKIPQIIRLHGGHHFFSDSLGKPVHFWRSWQEKKSFQHAGHIIAVSQHVGKKTMELLKLDLPFEVIPNFVDTFKFSISAIDEIEPQTILFYGTLTEKKGVHHLLEAFNRIKMAIPNAKLKIIGKDQTDPNTSKPYSLTLKALIDPKVVQSVTFLGAVEHQYMPDLIAKAQCCVFPSLMEAMPIAWLEAMAMGKAIVASNLGPGPEVIEHGKSGLLCDPRKIDDLTKNILAVLEDLELAKGLGKEARLRCETQFEMNYIAQTNESFYKRICGAKSL